MFLLCFLGFFAVFAIPMGLSNAINTMINTAYALLVDTVLYIMAMAVIAGAISALLTEFGVVTMLNRILSPLIYPLYGMPGAAALGIVTTYLSDNPAILTLADDPAYRQYFKKYQIPALTNLGTSFGMGLIVTTFMLGLGNRLEGPIVLSVLCGNLGAVVGSIVSTRLMLRATRKVFGKEQLAASVIVETLSSPAKTEKKAHGAIGILTTLMNGGKKGVELGLGIIPGVLIVCTLVMMLTNGPSASCEYTGGAYEGVALLPWISEKLKFILSPLFGFSDPAGIAVPITALGSAGAALGLIPSLIESGQASCGDVAVFMAMCMCWSGYLSTHVSMMDVLRCDEMTGKAILSHTVGGFFAGIVAHWLFAFASWLVTVL